jgi:homoserine O-acetyltransferase/O-succinyltransferase
MSPQPTFSSTIPVDSPVPVERGAVRLPARFPLARGGALSGASLGFTRLGCPDLPAVLVLGGISAGADVADDPAAGVRGWWPQQVGVGRALDPTVVQVIGIDWLAGPGRSMTGSRRAIAPSFVDTRDQAQALGHLLDQLTIPRLRLLVGSSYGGMVALQFAALLPQRCERLTVLCAAHESHPEASALRALQRRITLLGRDLGAPREGLRLARELALVGYRSAAEFALRFPGAPAFVGGELRCTAQGWLEARSEAFVRRFTVEQFLCLNRSIDAHQVEPERVTAETTLVSFATDRLVPPSQVAALAARLPRCARHVEVPTLYGHDGFLKEHDAVDRVLRSVVAEVQR